jgi:hypothetical protein
MSDPISREEFLAHIEPIRQDVQELVKLQREQNGRVFKLDARVGILEDRAPTRAAAAVGAASGTAAGALLALLQQFFGK